MPIDLLSCPKKTSKWAFASPIVNNILWNSLFVAAIIAFLMIIIIMVMYPAKQGTSFSIIVKMLYCYWIKIRHTRILTIADEGSKYLY